VVVEDQGTFSYQVGNTSDMAEDWHFSSRTRTGTFPSYSKLLQCSPLAVEGQGKSVRRPCSSEDMDSPLGCIDLASLDYLKGIFSCQQGNAPDMEWTWAGTSPWDGKHLPRLDDGKHHLLLVEVQGT